ncbi:MAG: hypothetical protein ACK52I_17715, partial [Pseudomonadota bacterium]
SSEGLGRRGVLGVAAGRQVRDAEKRGYAVGECRRRRPGRGAEQERAHGSLQRSRDPVSRGRGPPTANWASVPARPRPFRRRDDV